MKKTGLILLIILVSQAFCVGASASTFQQSIINGIQHIYPYIKNGVSAILFIFFIAKGISAVFGNQKEANWWELLGILSVIAFLQAAPTIYGLIAGITISG